MSCVPQSKTDLESLALYWRSRTVLGFLQRGPLHPDDAALALSHVVWPDAEAHELSLQAVREPEHAAA